MRQVLLPDCRSIAPPWGLSKRQRRELVRILAEEGPEALEAWLRREELRDPTIRRRLHEERERLEREARSARRRLEQSHAEEESHAETEWEARMRAMAQREQELHGRLQHLETAPLVTADLLRERSRLYRAVAEPVGRRSMWRRLNDLLVRFWVLLVSLWVRFVRWITGRGAPQPRRVVILPDGVQVDLARGLGPDAVVAMREATQDASWRERMKQAWDRMLGREDYAQTAERLMRQEMERLEAERERRRREEQERLRRELEGLEGEGGTERGRRDQERKERRRRHEKELEDLRRDEEEGPYRRLRGEVLRDLETMGLVDEEGRVTGNLLERFSLLLYDEARRSIPEGGATVPGTYVEGEGEYELGPLRSSHEIGAMDLVSSLVHARIHHPRVRHIYDDDVRVHREVRAATTHMVMVFDTSGSMELGGRLEAAKKVCMVLYRAVKDRNPDSRVDLIRMHTSVELVDLAGCWNSQPMGFTNHAAAFREAKRLFDDVGADHRMLYVVTDGLPEAYTKEDGTDKADRPDVCMEHALREARQLREVPALRTVVIQLETQEERYVEAAGELAEAANGRVEALDPKDLMAWVLGDYASAESP